MYLESRLSTHSHAFVVEDHGRLGFCFVLIVCMFLRITNFDVSPGFSSRKLTCGVKLI